MSLFEGSKLCRAKVSDLPCYNDQVSDGRSQLLVFVVREFLRIFKLGCD